MECDFKESDWKGLQDDKAESGYHGSFAAYSLCYIAIQRDKQTNKIRLKSGEKGFQDDKA